MDDLPLHNSDLAKNVLAGPPASQQKVFAYLVEQESNLGALQNVSIAVRWGRTRDPQVPTGQHGQCLTRRSGVILVQSSAASRPKLNKALLQESPELHAMLQQTWAASNKVFWIFNNPVPAK